MYGKFMERKKLMEEYRVNGIIEQGIYQGSYEDIKDFDKRLWRMVPVEKENIMVYDNNQMGEEELPTIDDIEEDGIQIDQDGIQVEIEKEEVVISPSLTYEKGKSTSKWLNVVGYGEFGRFNYEIKIR